MQQLVPANLTPDAEHAVEFRKYLHEIKLDKASPHLFALKYFLARMLYPNVKTPPNFLDSIVCPLAFASLNALIDTVTDRKATSFDLELLDKLTWALDELLLKPDDFHAVVNVLLSYSYRDNITTQLLQALVRRVYQRAKDQNSPELHLVINKMLLTLLQAGIYDRVRNFEKIAKLCAGLSNGDEDYTALITNFQIEELQWLFYRLLAFEDPQNFLRSSQFATKLSRFVMNKDKQQLAGAFNAQLDNVILVIIKSTGPLDLEHNALLAGNFAEAMQGFLNWLMGLEAHQIPLVAGLCSLIYGFVANHPHIKPDTYASYVSGFLILRFINTMILDYKEKLSERLKQDKFKGLNVTPDHLACCQRQILFLSKLVQAMSTKSEKMTEHEKVPAIQALRSPESIAKLSNWILKIANAKEFIQFKETAMDHCYYDVTTPVTNSCGEIFKGCQTASLRDISEETLVALGPWAQECAVSVMLQAWFDISNRKYKLLVSNPNLTFHKPLQPLVPFSILSGREQYFNPTDRIARMLKKINANCVSLKTELAQQCKGLQNLPVYTQAQVTQKITDYLDSIAEIETTLKSQKTALNDEQVRVHQRYLASLKQDLEFHQNLYKLQQLQHLKDDLTQLNRQCEIFVRYKKDARNQSSRQNVFPNKIN